MLKPLMEEFKLSAISAEILSLRGYDVEMARRLLFSNADRLFSQSSLAREQSAALQILKSSKKVGVFCDYDADGLMSSEVIRGMLDAAELSYDVYVPERLEGYGLSAKGIKKLAAVGADVLLTADCGSNDTAMIQLAQSLGMKVIVTDHHKYDQRPPADAFLNPVSTEFESLCGCAVAAMALRPLSESRFEAVRPFVAVATIADIVPLVQESRGFVAKFLDFPELPGVLEPAFQGLSVFSPNTIAFQVVPKFNAFSRMGKARELFRVRSMPVYDAAKKMVALNDERKQFQKKLLEETEPMVDASQDIIVLCIPDGYGDIIGFFGLLASRLTEKYKKPSLVGYMKDGRFKGSGRSPASINLYSVLTQTAGVYDLTFGGHSYALGYSAADVTDFSRIVNQTFANNRQDFETVCVDSCDLSLATRFLHTLEPAYSELRPFGAGFQPITVRLTDFSVVDAETRGFGRNFFAKVVRGNSLIYALGEHQSQLVALGKKPKDVFVALDGVEDGRLRFTISRIESPYLAAPAVPTPPKPLTRVPVLLADGQRRKRL